MISSKISFIYFTISYYVFVLDMVDNGKIDDKIKSSGYSWLLDTERPLGEEDRDFYESSLVEELDLDFMAIGKRVQYVVLPFVYQNEHNAVKENPDFWGPLFVVMTFSMVSC